jgi:beta-lactamase class D
MGGGLDRFWLHGDLRISAFEQVAFLERFHSGKLGLSSRTTEIMKGLMLLEDDGSYRLSGKSGTAEVTATRELGWLVGFLERGDETVFYALNIEGERVWEDWPPQKRPALVRRLLGELDLGP